MDCNISFNPIIDPCYKCKNREGCKDSEKFINIEQSIARQIQDMRLYGIDPVKMVKEYIDTHKDELVCENFIDDESVQRQSFLGILDLQNKNN